MCFRRTLDLAGEAQQKFGHVLESLPLIMDLGFGRSQVYKSQPWKTNCLGKLEETKIFLSGAFNAFLELSFGALGKAQVQGRIKQCPVSPSYLFTEEALQTW